MTCLVTTDDQQWWICWVKNTGVELVAITTQLMNTLPFVSWSKRPNSDRILTYRCQELTRRIPADRMNWFCMSLALQTHVRRPITYKRHQVYLAAPISGAFITIFDSFSYQKEKGKGTTRKGKKKFYMIMIRTHQGP